MPEEFTSGAFQPLIVEQVPDPSAVRRILLCSGKVYYDLVKHRDSLGVTDTAILRTERLYPLPARELTAALEAFPADASLIWVQEEPANQGAWPYIALRLPEHLGGRPLLRVSRNASAAPSTGSHHTHEIEQAALLDAAFA
jgi:2-oxoglutarate dehydrogenase E1 component